MWTRAELKQKAKFAFKRNYWRTVLVAMIIGLLAGGGRGISSYSEIFNKDSSSVQFEKNEDRSYSDEYSDDELKDDFWQGFKEGMGEFDDEFKEMTPQQKKAFENVSMAMVVVVVLIVVVIVLAVILVLSAFLLNPFDVGVKRFMLRNLNEPATVSNLGFAFDTNYKNIAKIMFMRDIKLIGWSLLLIIPGIVKSYEYQMIPYLLAENPNLSEDEAFAISKKMMYGVKWDAFVLDLSFILWHLFTVITFGFGSIFYVAPYIQMTKAALYERLRSDSKIDVNRYSQTGYLNNNYNNNNYNNYYKNPGYNNNNNMNYNNNMNNGMNYNNNMNNSMSYNNNMNNGMSYNNNMDNSNNNMNYNNNMDNSNNNMNYNNSDNNGVYNSAVSTNPQVQSDESANPDVNVSENVLENDVKNMHNYGFANRSYVNINKSNETTEESDKLGE